MRKVYIFVLIIVLSAACLALSSCAGKTAFEDIVITGSDVTDLPEGAYTLRYDLINLEEYAKKHDYSLTVTVADQNHKQVAVENKRIIRVQADFVYYVTVLLSGENGKRTKQHNYTVYAVKNDVAITFSSGGYDNFVDFVITVPYGGTLTDVPEVPEYTPPPPREGYTRTVSKAVWDRKEYVDLTVPITVRPVYTVTDTEKSFVLTYDSGGGTTIAAETYLFYSIPTPPTAPEKEGRVFFGWYADAALKIPFAFSPLRQDITVYARWITPNDCTPVGYFDFELVEGEGGYSVKAKDKDGMPAEVVIPNTNDGKPVVSIAAAGFSKCSGMLRITIPDTVESIGVLAFCAKDDATDGSPLSDLESVVFETAHLAVIPQSAFYGCDKLTQIDIPDSVEHIESQAFYGCALLESVNFSGSSMLRQISDEAFYGCSSLSSIVLPKTVERLNSLAFYNCASPFSVTILSPAAPYLDDEDGCIFGRDVEGCCEKDGVFVYVLAELTETYKALEPYQGYDIRAVPEP